MQVIYCKGQLRAVPTAIYQTIPNVGKTEYWKIGCSQRFGNVRAIMRDGEPWFVGKDVANILGYANPSEAIQDHVDAEDKLSSKTLLSCNLDLGQRGGWLINESGLYSLVLSSKLPDAKAFKQWVTSEILPPIRRTGGAGILAGIGLNTPHYQTVGNIRCYESSGVAYLDLEAVAKGLGITKKANSGNEVVHWTRLREYLADFGVVQKCTTGDFIPENIFYRLAKKVPRLDMLDDSELPAAISTAVAMCCEQGVDINDILQNVAA